MPTKRTQRRVLRLLKETDAAVRRRGWSEPVLGLGQEDGQPHIVMEA